ncbi:MAG: ParA family protein [Clostridiales bacterium]|nr:ParA family protein [Clostridiales bacterium]
MNFRRITLICGHYGCGKTNLSVNFALDAAAGGENVTVVDLDIVNPYFRTSDYSELLKSHGVRLIAPRYSGSTLDIPSIPGEINSVFDSIEGRVLFDVGGDDAGSTALGRYASQFEGVDYDLLYVINKYRPLTASSGDAAQLLSEIERSSRLKATGIVNNSHLMSDTTCDTIRSSMDFARETAEQLKLPLLMTTAPRSVAATLDIENLYPIDIYVRTPWM